MTFYIPHIVDKIRVEFAVIERAIAEGGAIALDRVRAAVKRIEGHTDTIHAVATKEQPPPGAREAGTAAVAAALLFAQPGEA